MQYYSQLSNKKLMKMYSYTYLHVAPYHVLQVGSYSDDLLYKLIPLDKLELDTELAQLFIDVFKKDPFLCPTAGELLKRPMIDLAQDYFREES